MAVSNIYEREYIRLRHYSLLKAPWYAIVYISRQVGGESREVQEEYMLRGNRCDSAMILACAALKATVIAMYI